MARKVTAAQYDKAQREMLAAIRTMKRDGKTNDDIARLARGMAELDDRLTVLDREFEAKRRAQKAAGDGDSSVNRTLLYGAVPKANP